MLVHAERYCLILTGLFLSLVMAACTDSKVTSNKPLYQEIEVWAHSGSPAHSRAIQQQVVRFNSIQHEIRVNVVILPEGSYEEKLATAAAKNKLPDIVEVAAPYIYQYAESGLLQPLDKWLMQADLDEFLPAIIRQSMYHGRLYAVMPTVSGVVMFANRKLLDQAGVKLPGKATGLSVNEFSNALARLARYDSDGAVLDMQLYRNGDWPGLVMMPLLYSANGGLIIKQGTDRFVQGLDSEQTLRVLETVQQWIRKGYVVDSPASFIKGEVAMVVAGHQSFWQYYTALGDDLLVMPFPDFGHGGKIALDSWSWGLTRQCKDPQAAMHLLEFLLRDEEVMTMADATGTLPALKSVIAEAEDYGPDGQLAMMPQLIEQSAVMPESAVYPYVTRIFQQAFAKIRGGDSVRTTMAKAAVAADKVLAGNQKKLEGRL